MADKQAVTELLNRAGVAYDTGDSDFLIDMFAPDGPAFEMTIAGGEPIVFQGSEAIAGPSPAPCGNRPTSAVMW